MSHKIPCPIDGYDTVDEQGDPLYWIDIPADEEWLGVHMNRVDIAMRKAQAAGQESSAVNFLAGMMLLNEWNLPGMSGTPDMWIFEKIDARVIAWIVSVVWPRYNKMFEVKKNYSNGSTIGPMNIRARKPEAAGT